MISTREKATKTLGDVIWFPNGETNVKTPDITAVEKETTERDMITRADMLGVGANRNSSQTVGSSAVTMHIDLPAALFMSDKILEIQNNVTEVTKYIKKLVTTIERFKLIHDNDSETLEKIREAARLGKEARESCLI